MIKSGVYTQLAPVQFGSGSVSMAGEVASSFNLTRVMIVTDAGVVGVGHDQKVIASLEKSGITPLLWDNVEPECPEAVLREAVAFARDNQIDGLIGLGGGSSMDTAKIASVMIPNDMDDILSHLNTYLFGEKKYAKPQLPVILIPTTFGTGSESTYVGMVTSDTEKFKIGVLCNPSYGIIDPALSLGLPALSTAFTGMDAFSHALEALGSIPRTPHSDLLAYEAIRLITKWLPVACKDINDLEAREYMALACNFAGISFSESGVHIGHCIAHFLGYDFHMAHGWTCALATPPIVELMGVHFPEQTVKLAEAMELDIPADTQDIGKFVADAIRSLMHSLGIPSLAAQGITREQAMAYAPLVNEHFLSHVFDVTIDLPLCEAYMASLYDNYK